MQAVEAKDPFAIAILDMQMPGMDGSSLGRAVKAIPAVQNTRLVMCTSLGRLGAGHGDEGIGFVATLTKPVRRNELREALNAAMGGASAPAPEAKAVSAFLPGADSGRIRLLLAEDNSTNQQVALGLLAKLGLPADVAANGNEAIKALETRRYDLVLMDVQMPEMDGLQATRKIRNPQSRVLDHNVPIVAMTAHAMKGDRERCLEAGMSDHLTKPIELATLGAAIQKWLGIALMTSAEVQEDSAAPENDQANIFDRSAFMRRVMNDEHLARTILERFLADSPTQIAMLKSCVLSGDARGVEELGHKLKGAASVVGGETLRKVAAAMELSGRSGDMASARDQMPSLENAFIALQAATDGWTRA